MDVDSSFVFDQPAVPLSAAPTLTAFQDFSSPAPAAAPAFATHFRDLSSPMPAPGTQGADFGNLFYDTSSPPPQQRRSLDSPGGRAISRKRRSTSPESPRTAAMLDAHVDAASSSPAASSPMTRKLERIASNPLLSKFIRSVAERSPDAARDLGSPLTLNLSKRPRRPALSALYAPGDMSSVGHAHSAYPITKAESQQPEQAQVPRRPAAGLPPPRRAFSAMMPPTGFVKLDTVPQSPADEGDASFGDASFGAHDVDFSSPAQAYAKRAQAKTIRRCDGTEDFRPLTGATALMKRDGEVMQAQMSPGTRGLMSPGLPGFGDNEAHGKILPCHRVKEDGLMRINPKTVTHPMIL
jgi:M-phase inducer tyrosine phosphatase